MFQKFKSSKVKATGVYGFVKECTLQPDYTLLAANKRCPILNFDFYILILKRTRVFMMMRINADGLNVFPLWLK